MCLAATYDGNNFLTTVGSVKKVSLQNLRFEGFFNVNIFIIQF